MPFFRLWSLDVSVWICILYSFFAFSYFVELADGLPKIASGLANSICEQHEKFSSLQEIQPPLKSIELSGQDAGECGWWSWSKSMEFEHGPDEFHTVPPFFSYKSCPSSRAKSSLPPDWDQEKYSHEAKPLTPEEFQYFVNHSDDPTKNFEYFLDPILIVRPPGTENNTKVVQFIADEMKILNWDVEMHSFEEETPLGPITFTNVIATLNPNVPRRLVLACHFDSRLTASGVFLGACDSAAPCAMLLQMAHDLKSSFDQHKENSDAKVSVQFLFFDGEEALVKWENNDNLYGSRALAEKWGKTPYPLEKQEPTAGYIDRMDLMVLLDLLGGPSPKFKDMFNGTTTQWYNIMVESEAWLRSEGIWETDVGEDKYFTDRKGGRVSDDHLHFFKRGVPILHLIRSPFPPVWHTDEDNRESLDFPAITNLVRIFRIFLARYLHLKIPS